MSKTKPKTKMKRMTQDEAYTLLTRQNQKLVEYERTHVEVDTQSGLIHRMVSEQHFKVDKEPEYIKVYIESMLVFGGCDPSLAPYLLALCKHMTYANHKEEYYRSTVRTDQIVRMAVAEEVGVSERSVHSAIKRLINNGILIPIVINGNKKRGIYFVNPWVVARGEWRDIKKLQAQFEFVSGEAAVLTIDSEGNQKAIMPLSKLRADTTTGQYMLPECSENNDDDDDEEE